jgi:cell division protein FtsI (penicillin-binding protein 3)
VIVLLLLAVVGRLVQLQGVAGQSYAQQAVVEQSHTTIIPAVRGAIVDRNGSPLAMTVADRTVFVDPTQVHAALASNASALAPLLGLTPAAIITAEQTPHTEYVTLARAVSPLVADQVMALRLPGIGTLPNPQTVFPSGALAANIVGFPSTGPGSVGLGLEMSENSLLAGAPGHTTALYGLDGAMIPGTTRSSVPATNGTTIGLTIDSALQWEAMTQVQQAVIRSAADSGEIVIEDPHSGQVLAMANWPTFDPNQLSKAVITDMGNPSVQDPYEPGSVNKIITLAAALSQHIVTPMTSIVVPPVLAVDGKVFHDAETHGTEDLTVTGVLAHSSNIGAIEIEKRIGDATLYHYLQAFGFGQSTGSGLPGESGGILPPLSQWTATTGDTIAFGQGVSATALQVADVYSTIANGGVRVIPSVIRGYGTGAYFHPVRATRGVRVISAAVASELSHMLEAVTTDGGTAPLAQIAGYRVAGKTGTASRYEESCHGYCGYTASFVGFAPADKPALVVEVVLNNPRNDYFGGTVAAPVFSTVMSFALTHLHIAPTYTRAAAPILTATGG